MVKNNYLCSWIKNRMVMKRRNNRRNMPIATLIKNYVDKKSGKVSEARDEIKWRFRAQDWTVQKKILAAFLEGGKTDRRWAYSELLDLWDNSFEEKVKELWEKYHEDRCKWVVIRYLPLDYVRQNMQNFVDERDYFFACLRLAEDKTYVIEREKLSNTDYLSVLYHSGRGVDEQEGLDILYNIVRDYCVKGIDRYDVNTRWPALMGELEGPVHLRNVRLAIYYLERADCRKPVLEFEEWSDKVIKAMNDSEELKYLNFHPSSDNDYDNRKLGILRKYAYLALDDKYKMPLDPSPDFFLKPVEEYSDESGTIHDLSRESLSLLSSSDASSDYNGEELLPF